MFLITIIEKFFMILQLVRAKEQDAELIWLMQVEAFTDLFTKYQDKDTNPANETVDRTIYRLKQLETYFYLIQLDRNYVGAVRVIDEKNDKAKRISPLFVLPKYRNRGIAQKALWEVENIHGNKHWILETILEEKVSCHLYEKMGYRRRIGDKKIINSRMTLITYEK